MTILDNLTSEVVIKKSKFITLITHVESKEEVDRVLQEVRNKYKDVDIQFLVGEKPWYLRHVMFILLKKYRFGLDIDYHFVTERLIKKVHKYGLKINTWTVDDKLVAEQFAKWGIDQITSNGLE